MKTIMLFFYILLEACFGVYAQKPIEDFSKTEADIYWESIPKYQINYKKPYDTTKRKYLLYSLNIGPTTETELQNTYTQQELIEFNASQIKKNIYDELYKRVLLDWGVEFWKRYPSDKRRFDWFLAINDWRGWPAFFTNLREGALAQLEKRNVVLLDSITKNEWKSLYHKYLQEFMASTYVDLDEKKRLLDIKLTWDIFKYWRNSERDKFDIDEYVNYAVLYSKLGDTKLISRHLKVVNRDKIRLGLDDKDIFRYIELLKKTDISDYQTAAMQMESLMKLQQVPIQLNAKSIEGTQIDLKKYKGKLVLLDFWSLGCTVCIEKMSEFKSVYEKYRSKGFEVISACFYSEKERNTILAIHKKMGADWPLVLLDRNPDAIGGNIKNTYGFQSVPQLLLLDEEGKLLHYMGDMMNKGGVEKLVVQHLNNKVKSGK